MKTVVEFVKEWDYIRENLTQKQQYEELGCYVSYCNMRDRELEEMDFVRTQIDEMLKTVDSDSLKAGIYNQLNRICFGAYQTQKRQGSENKEYLAEAVSALERATQIIPDDASYLYNLAVCRREQGNIEGAVDAIRKCLNLKTDDATHLTMAYRIFKEVGMEKEAEDVRNQLRRINPRRAAML